MDVLEKIFGSAAKVKVMRLFLFNPNSNFNLDQVVSRARISPQAARAVLRPLQDIGLIKSKVFFKTERRKEGKKRVEVKKKVKGWCLNDGFSYLLPLQSFLINASPLSEKTIIRKFSRAGTIKLLVISGVFLHEKDSRVDILVVGDALRKSVIDSAIKDIEAELGKELSYSVFETKDFQYRIGMYDKLVRDILDYPHKKIVNRIGA